MKPSSLLGTFVSTAAVLLVAACSTLEKLHYNPKSHNPRTAISGTLTDIHGREITVSSKAGHSRTFETRYDTEIAINGNSSSRGGLEKGMIVQVTPKPTDHRLATSIIATGSGQRR